MNTKMKRFVRIGIITILILLLGFTVFLISAIPTAKRAVLKVCCTAHLHGLYLAVHEYHQYIDKVQIDDKIPFFGDKTTGEEYWSWRATYLFWGEYPPNKDSFRLSEPWDSEYNLPLFQKKVAGSQKKMWYARYMFCPGDEQREKSSYVAVTGPGTVWTEMQNGNLSENVWDYAEKILIIETSEPKNFWAEPGDDVSPEEVIRLFEADPGLVKNSKQKWWDRSHWPKHYVNAIGDVKSFDTIKDVEELRKLLTVSPEQIEAVRKKVEERNEK